MLMGHGSVVRNTSRPVMEDSGGCKQESSHLQITNGVGPLS